MHKRANRFLEIIELSGHGAAVWVVEGLLLRVNVRFGCYMT
jgi:hypothetical protein